MRPPGGIRVGDAETPATTRPTLSAIDREFVPPAVFPALHARFVAEFANGLRDRDAQCGASRGFEPENVRADASAGLCAVMDPQDPHAAASLAHSYRSA